MKVNKTQNSMPGHNYAWHFHALWPGMSLPNHTLNRWNMIFFLRFTIIYIHRIYIYLSSDLFCFCFVFYRDDACVCPVPESKHCQPNRIKPELQEKKKKKRTKTNLIHTDNSKYMTYSYFMHSSNFVFMYPLIINEPKYMHIEFETKYL